MDPHSHTGHELDLMLSGQKPFASFARYIDEDFDELSGQDFYAHVQAGRLKQHRIYVMRGERRMRYTLFTLAGEEWRVPIYKRVINTLESQWNDTLEALEGLLLGYSLAETQAHIENCALGRIMSKHGISRQAPSR